MAAEEAESPFIVHVHVKDKVIDVCCGRGTAPQAVRWLGHVGIARFDETDLRGWVSLGVPTAVRRDAPDGEELDLEELIERCLAPGTHVYVSHTMGNDDS